MTLLRTYADLLGGDIVGQQVLFPPPGYSKRDRSASLRFDPNAPNGFVAHSFAGEDPLPIRDYVKERLGLLKGKSTQTVLPFSKQDDSQVMHNIRALTIWEEGYDPRGTAVQIHLRRRGLQLPDEAACEAIRFHPACPFAGERTPAMVCLVRDVVTNKPKAVHRTALDHDGQKREIRGHSRLSLGSVAGGAIKLTPDENVTTCLGVGEGVESALSLRNIPEYGPSPVWSLISAGGVKHMPVLDGIESLWIAVDHDPTGITAARSTAHRWQASGAEAFLITPSAPRADLNNLFAAGADHA